MIKTMKLAMLGGLAAVAVAGMAAVARAPRADACTTTTCPVGTQPAQPVASTMPVLTQAPSVFVVKPDLAVDLSGCGAVNAGATCSATAVLHNKGLAKATPVALRIAVTAGTLAEIQGYDGLTCSLLSGTTAACRMMTLGAGVDAKAIVKVTAPKAAQPGQPATFSIIATADPDDLVDETNEGNNGAIKSVYYGPTM
jgi:hypothetical protein